MVRKVLISKQNTDSLKKYLIPQNSDVKDCNWLEIKIDFAINVFVARKVLIENPGNEWELYNDYTFPTSLLNQFMSVD